MANWCSNWVTVECYFHSPSMQLYAGEKVWVEYFYPWLDPEVMIIWKIYKITGLIQTRDLYTDLT